MKKNQRDTVTLNKKAEIPGIEMKRTGEWLRCITRHKGISVRDLCASVGIASPQSVYGWFCGHSLPSLDNLYALGYVFCMPMDDLIIDRTKALPNRFCKIENRLAARMLCYRLKFQRISL